MNAFLETIRNLGVGRLATAAGMTIGLIVFFVFLATRLSTSQLALLFDDLRPDDSSRVVAELQSMGVPFEVSSDRRQVRVPSDHVARLRLTLAEQGLPEAGSIGYEIFDRDQSLGTSSFVQNINHVRALEGELSRTVATIASVKGARVHLVLPRRELFSRQRLEPSASVILKMRGAARLDRQQVAAVLHLVATAVPDLRPERISIIDDRGTLLAGGGERDGPGAAASSLEERRIALETRLNRALKQLLEPSLGIGNVRSEVFVDMDFDRVVTNQETFDPESQVARSTQSITESSTDSERDTGAVTIAQNLPDAQMGDDNMRSQSASNRLEESTNFEISKTIRQHIREGGQVQRLSVAVLINDRTVEGADGRITYEARGEQELANIEKLVRSAVGFNAERGDTVEIVNMRFAEFPQLVGGLDDAFFLGFSTADIRRLVEVFILAVVGVLIILLVVRPLIAKIFETAPAALAAAGAGGGTRPLLTDQGAVDSVGAIAPPGARSSGMLASGQGGDVDRMLDLAQVEGRVRASSMRRVGDIIEQHPEEAVSIIRSWMYQERA